MLVLHCFLVYPNFNLNFEGFFDPAAEAPGLELGFFGLDFGLGGFLLPLDSSVGGYSSSGS